MANSKSYDAIDYDEYLDGGIPDTLLQGLGFYANSGDAEKASEADEVLDDSPKPETVTEPQPHSVSTESHSVSTESHSVSAESPTTTGLSGKLRLSDVLPIPRRRGRPPKSSPYAHVPPPVKPAHIQPTTVAVEPRTRITNSMQFPPSKPGDLATNTTIIKGNIMYQRTESGEVIASVIKNGPQSVPLMSAGRRGGRPTAAAASLSVPGENDLNVNEDNVERILDESITATVAVRRTLVSLKDDLRRMGGGPAMSASLKPIHLQHRINIAYKLARAFTDYRSTMNGIISGKTDTKSETVKTVTLPDPSTQIARPVTASIVSAPQATCSSQRNVPAATTSQQETAASSTAEATDQEQKLKDVVSDDLCMSCDYD